MNVLLFILASAMVVATTAGGTSLLPAVRRRWIARSVLTTMLGLAFIALGFRVDDIIYRPIEALMFLVGCFSTAYAIVLIVEWSFGVFRARD